MSKIIGDKNPQIGKKYRYSIIDDTEINLTLSNELVTYIWEIYLQQSTGKWVNITSDKNPKIGKEVTYDFTQKAKGRTYKLLVKRATKKHFSKDYNFEELKEFLIVPTSTSEQKIQKVILYNKGARNVNKASYTDTLVAKAFCIGMFDKTIEFQVWEDDAKGPGHNAEINKNNAIPIKYKGIVDIHGVAQVKIPLSDNPKLFQEIANRYMMAGEKDEGVFHEYYVTASYLGSIQGASQVNVEVENPSYKKEKISKESALYPIGFGSKRQDIAQKITSAFFVDEAGERMKRVSIGDRVRVKISTEGFKDKYLQYVVWEKDISGNHDEIYRSNRIQIPYGVHVDEGFIITEEIFKKGIDFSMGNYFIPDPDAKKQNYFLEIIPLDMSISSKNFGIDDKIGLIEVEKVRSASKVENTEASETLTEKKCFCNRDFEESDVKELVKLLKGRETIWEGYKTAPCNIDDKSFSRLTKGLNAMFKKYNINHCAQKLHFLAQAAHETDNFTLSEETESSHASSQSVYKGRGILQMTGVKKEENSNYYDAPGPFKTYGDYAGINTVKDPSIVAKQIEYVIDSGGWMYSIFKKMPSDKNSTVWERWGEHKEKTIGKSLNELALYGDEYLELISALLNGRPKPSAMPNGWTKRKKNYDLLKTGFFNYDFYHNGKQKTGATETDIVTYHIYADGRIEKHIPKTIKSGYENKYKYVYHDSSGNMHNICTVDWHITKEKEKGKNKGKVKPAHSKILSEKDVKEGQTQKRVIYENGDVAEYGSNKGVNFWNLYVSSGMKIELVRMPDSLNYNNSGIVVKYSFSNTQRRYTSPGAMAGFIGALAEDGLTGVKTTGSCFKEGTCFPSVAHVNGKSIDTTYMDRPSQTKFIAAMNKFHFTYQITGNDKTHSYSGTTQKSDHNDHLHSGFDESKIKIINEK